MLYEWLYPLREHIQWLSWLRVLRYVPVRAIGAWLSSMIIFFIMFPWFINTLKQQQIGQQVRDDGPKSHFSKSGVPTMGGSLILLIVILSTVLWANLHNYFIWLAVTITVCYGGIGFLDDYIKIKNKNSKGLPAVWKFFLQFLVAFAIIGFLFYSDSLPYEWKIIKDRLALPFVAFDKYRFSLPLWIYVIFGSTVVVGTSNAVNLTDGLDGLAIGPVMINAVTYLLLAYLGSATFYRLSIAHYLDIPYIPTASELSIFCASIVGVGFGFLWYNTFPATIFMGDVGSLSLGGALGICAVLTKNEILSIILGGVFVAEAMSVIIQVTSFKLTGKRVFKMAPLHHHFELRGWAEPKVIVRFWIISIILSLITLAQLKLR